MVTVMGWPGPSRTGGEQRTAMAVAAQLHTSTSPTATGDGPLTLLAETRIEIDHGFDRAALSSQPTHEQVRR